jgi:hypothetical protein
MALALIWGVTMGDLWTEGGAMLDMPWGLFLQQYFYQVLLGVCTQKTRGCYRRLQ